MKKVLILGLFILAGNSYADVSGWGKTQNGAGITTNEHTLNVSSTTAVANTPITLTIPAHGGVDNSGVGQFTYITDIHMELVSTATVAGVSTPFICTTTNITNSPQFDFPSAQTVGTVSFYNIDYVFPLQTATTNTATTIVCPKVGSGIWNLSANYYYDD